MHALAAVHTCVHTPSAHKCLHPPAHATIAQVTPSQVKYLKMLGVKAEQLATLTKTTASELICSMAQARQSLAPTDAQLELLKAMRYAGPMPATRTKATDIISEMRMNKRIAYLKAKGQRRGMTTEAIKEIVNLVIKHGL